MKFIVYNAEGDILRIGYAPAWDFYKQTKDGEFVIEGEANDMTDKVDPQTKQIRRGVKERPSRKRTDEYLIRREINDILRQMAIEKLTNEGKLHGSEHDS